MQTVYNRFRLRHVLRAARQRYNSGKIDRLDHDQPDCQSVMPNAIPAANTTSSSSVSYWGSYFTLR